MCPLKNSPRWKVEELALLGEEEAEPRQVHLLLVDLDLREIGVIGEVGREVLRHAVLDVNAEGAVAFVRDARDRIDVGRE